jgi:hypothetical protein
LVKRHLWKTKSTSLCRARSVIKWIRSLLGVGGGSKRNGSYSDSVDDFNQARKEVMGGPNVNGPATILPRNGLDCVRSPIQHIIQSTRTRATILKLSPALLSQSVPETARPLELTRTRCSRRHGLEVAIRFDGTALVGLALRRCHRRLRGNCPGLQLGSTRTGQILIECD